MISRAGGGVTVHIHFTRCCICWCWRTDWNNPCSAAFLTDLKVFLKGHLTPYARCIKGGCMCGYAPWDAAWVYPSLTPCLFSSDLSQNNFLVLVTHQLLFSSFFAPLLYISQPLQSIARSQIPWYGAQGKEEMSFNTTCDSQMLLLICSKGCLWTMWRSRWQSEGPKLSRGRKRGKKKGR